MTEKKGILGFLKSWGVGASEETEQASYGENQEQVDGNSLKKSEDIITNEIEDFAIEKLEEFLDLASFSGKIRTKSNSGYTLHLEIFDVSEHDLGRIIGKGGNTLKAFQLLIKFTLIRKFNVSLRVILDAGDYHTKRESQLKKTALQAADQVLNSGTEVSLEPMPASERRFIHMLFEKNRKVESESSGEGSDRHVLLKKRNA
jgi:spoIIIJ-associated protein